MASADIRISLRKSFGLENPWGKWAGLGGPSLRAADTIQLKAGEALEHARNLDTNTLGSGVPAGESVLLLAKG
jgi:hypothetical protein